jgi:hypothetical protein
MTFEADLLNFLKGDDSLVAALRDTGANEVRIYPLERPTNQRNTGAVVYTVVADNPVTDLDSGDSGDDVAGELAEKRVQIDVYGKNYDEARATARLVRARLKSSSAAISATLLSASSSLDPDTRERREVLDFSIWHSPQ